VHWAGAHVLAQALKKLLRLIKKKLDVLEERKVG